MCSVCDNNQREHGAPVLDRRKFLVAGMGATAAPWLTRVATGAPAAQTDAPVGKNPFSARAWGATSATSPLGAMEIERRAVGPNDVLLDIFYCGICHSDIHQVRNEWPTDFPTSFPCVPGHEIVGRVQAVGGIAETQEVIDYCAARNIKADIELIRADQINEVIDRVVAKDVRYRFVIDFTSTKQAA